MMESVLLLESDTRKVSKCTAEKRTNRTAFLSLSDVLKIRLERH